MDEWGITVITYDYLMIIIDNTVDLYRVVENNGGSFNMDYVDVRLEYHFDDMAQTSYYVILTISDGMTKVISEIDSTTTWQRQGNVWKNICD